jgi:amidohydrolase
MISQKLIGDLIDLRQFLHQHPELSNHEIKTAQHISDFLERFNPDRIESEIGGNGLLAEFRGKSKGPTLMFRCELDGLPIEEKNDIGYRSVNNKVSHVCGHDGHMAIVAGLAGVLGKNRPENGRILLLFQPSEETGQGAANVLHDTKFKPYHPDYVFALHNLPGIALNKVIISRNVFSAASAGMRIQLIGKSSHAAEPEKGINPGHGMAQMVMAFQDLMKIRNFFEEFAHVTPIHLRLGDIAYGTSPGEGAIHLTLRSYLNKDMNVLKQEIESLTNSICQREKLSYEINYEEVFPSTANHLDAAKIVAKAAKMEKLDLRYISKPFRWSEDFGHFTSRFRGAMFGLGSGLEQPALHNPDFDFPDELIPVGLKIYLNICQQLLSFNK